MKSLFSKIILVIALLNCMTCEKRNLDEVNFLSVKSGEVILADEFSMTIESEISGLVEGRIKEHGHLLSSIHSDPKFGQPDVDPFLKGIALKNGKFENKIDGLTYNRRYYARAFLLLDENPEPVYGEVITHTLGETELNVTMDAVNLFPGGFELIGGVTGFESDDILAQKHGFVWSNENEIPTLTDEVLYLGTIGENRSFEVKMENAPSLRNYYVRSFIQIGDSLYYSTETKAFFKGDVWVRKMDALIPILGGYFAAVGDAGYVGGGFSPNGFSTALQKYIPAEDKWESKSPLPITSSYNNAAFGIGDFLYTTTDNGVDPLRTLWAYDAPNNTWSQREPTQILEPLYKPMGITIQGKGYIGCGQNGIDPNIDNTKMIIYDPEMNDWEPLAPAFVIPGRDVKFIFSNENELFFGLEYNEIWSFDLNDNDWGNSSINFPEEPDFFPWDSNGTSIGNKAYIVHTTSTNNFWEFDMIKKRWRALSDYPGPTKEFPAYFTINGRFYFGLGRSLGEPSSDFWEYIPDIEEL